MKSQQGNLRRGNKARAVDYAGGGNVTWHGSHVDWGVSRDIGGAPRDRLSSPSRFARTGRHRARDANSRCVHASQAGYGLSRREPSSFCGEGVGYAIRRTQHHLPTDLPTSLQRARLRRHKNTGDLCCLSFVCAGTGGGWRDSRPYRTTEHTRETQRNSLKGGLINSRACLSQRTAASSATPRRMHQRVGSAPL